MTLDCKKMFLESDRKQQSRVISRGGGESPLNGDAPARRGSALGSPSGGAVSEAD